MDSILKGIFGGDGGNQAQSQAQDFVSRYEQGHPWTNFSGQEAVQRYQQVAPQLSPVQYQQAAEQAFGRMPADQRTQLGQLFQQQGTAAPSGDYQMGDPRQLAQMATQYRQQNPGGLASLFGAGGASAAGASGGGGMDLGGVLDNPLAKAALGGLAAMAVKRLMDR